jgi:putative protease
MVIELLAPVRDRVSLAAALDAGADSVYFGLGTLNMRSGSKGIDPAELPEIVCQTHQRGVKVYVTLNTIVYDNEIEIIKSLLNKIKEANVDAVICWDPAVIKLSCQLGIPFHVSTQANVTNVISVKFYETLGARCVVLARELTLEQIKAIKSQTSIKIETFVHGAMCVSVSGRCYLSQFLSCKSANRGECLQPCRRRYRLTDLETNDELELGSDYILSPKDLCALPILDKLIEAGIDVFKIEGRSRPPEYVRTVVAAYRRAIDAINNGQFNESLVNELMAEVSKVYNRGFSRGFYLGRPGPADWADRGDNHASQTKSYIGKVLNYYAKPKIAHIKVCNALTVGDVVQAHGPTTGVAEFKIAELKTDSDGYVTKVISGNATFPTDVRLRPNDQIYKITSVVPAE